MIDKDRFFKATALPSKQVEVSGYGSLTLYGLTLKQRLQLVDKLNDDEATALAWVICQSVEGLDEEDLPFVLDMAPEHLQQLSDEVLEVSGISSSEVTEAKND